MENQQKKKSSGSFYIPIAAIKKLIRTGKEGRNLIPGYLKIAAHTGPEGLYSTAGHTSLKNNLPVSNTTAAKLVKQLVEMNLLYTAEQWTEKTGETFPDDVPPHRQIKYVLNHFDEDQQDMVWISMGLINGVDSFDEPLRELSFCGADACRMLLYFHQEYDPEVFHACAPLKTGFRHYTLCNDQASTNYMIKGWDKGLQQLSGHLLPNVFPMKNDWNELDEDAAWHEKGAPWEAFNNLISHGFIYEVSAVVSTPLKLKKVESKMEFESDGTPYNEYESEWDYADLKHMGVVYELATHCRFARTTGDLHEAIKATYKEVSGGSSSADVYSILPTGSNHSVIGLYRPRFVVGNKRNAYVSETHNRKAKNQAKAWRWLNHFSTTKGLPGYPSQQSPKAGSSAPKEKPAAKPVWMSEQEDREIGEYIAGEIDELYKGFE